MIFLKTCLIKHSNNKQTSSQQDKNIATEFDDLGYRYFNTTGVDDNSTPASADVNDFQEYIYTAGVTDDGIGDPLEEFISFQIKIIMQGTNSAQIPRIKELRAIALVT